MRIKLQQASEKGKVLRYAAEVKGGEVKVGVVEVGPSSSMGKLVKRGDAV